LEILKKILSVSYNKKTACNERFGATAAVALRKRQCRIELLSPAWKVV